MLTLLSPLGNIRNTEKLSYDRQQEYEIQVIAWDCGQKRAVRSVPVHIDVKSVCKPGWQGRSSLYLLMFVCVRSCRCASRCKTKSNRDVNTCADVSEYTCSLIYFDFVHLLLLPSLGNWSKLGWIDN